MATGILNVVSDLQCNIPFGVDIGPTKVAVSPVGTIPDVDPDHGGLWHCTLRINWFWSHETHRSVEGGFISLQMRVLHHPTHSLECEWDWAVFGDHPKWWQSTRTWKVESTCKEASKKKTIDDGRGGRRCKACWSKIGNVGVKRRAWWKKLRTFNCAILCVHLYTLYLVCWKWKCTNKKKPCVQHRRVVLDVAASIKSRFRDHDCTHKICAGAIDRKSGRAWCVTKEVSNAWSGLHYTYTQEKSRRLGC